ncbi:mitochondrial inner membrane translocase subunit TIM44, putative [Babesia bigemina]|uniref:Mitochondrial inner membrane translocase subunit TIM44, putative n=1 Tax=Babesia bigemina TaxID=5866 RepID=A0A061D0T9_BABBI|nr:mitochondrial inner membrane translocase subunit TIM44, putative [Babesia bigemina]CDR94253.1 mitochondrial inner membrane translocase subunit TIM44, putative [Babesia bigemina]|eukprot:XP_012766439.1 mitochondrial inner membrane translocase subunit TIM44, putative [Babesia bigemina]
MRSDRLASFVATGIHRSYAALRGLPRSYHRNSQPAHAYTATHGSRRFNSDSFVQSVINQVKRDLEKDEKLQEAIKSLEKSKITQKVNRFGEILNRSKDICGHYVSRVSETSSKSRAIQLAITSAKNVVCGINKVAEMIHDEEREVKELRAKWKQRVVNQRQKMDINNAQEGSLGLHDGRKPDDTTTNRIEDALVLSKESAWERFGSRLRDMPFLANFFENPLFEQLFGKSTLATAIRDMKQLDPCFSIPELMELVEHVVAPHIVQCYLTGDVESLKMHCGDVAFNVLSASIRERSLQKLELDHNILILKDVELKGGITMPGSDPWFIFNFTTQQINCLRDYHGNVVAGEVDDIREVVYSMALSRHPDLSQDALEYPYMVHEMAIVGNRPCW